MKPHKILYIVQHRFNRSPGQRYRCEQYIRFLQKNGFDYTFSPIIRNETEERALYNSKKYSQKAMVFIKSFFRRLYDVWRARNYDIIFIYREAFMTGSVLFEKLLKKSGAKIIVDFDDAIWLPAVSEVNRPLQWLKRPRKIDEIIALSDLVIAGNGFLASHAEKFNNHVIVFPSTIDLDYYLMGERQKELNEENKIIIGWSGSHTTIEHFTTLVPVLKRLKKKFNDKLAFSVYGDSNYLNTELEIKGLPWSPDTEIKVISSFDIGIMPLPDNPWSQGKCSMKALQYMGLGVPAVATSLGMNKEVIADGENGYLAGNDNEWFEKLSLLIENKALREKIGLAGRKTIEDVYSCQVRSKEYVNLFLELTRVKNMDTH